MLPWQWIHTFMTLLFENIFIFAKKILYHDNNELSNDVLA